MPERTLGTGALSAMLYDKGGERQIATFDGIIGCEWGRLLNDTSDAALTIGLTGGVPDCCDWLGDIRSVRHELVIFRDEQRVWEGPVTRVQYHSDKVIVLAKDVSFWLDRRAHRGRFTRPTKNAYGAWEIADVNSVIEGNQAILDAVYSGDPNISPWVQVVTTDAEGTVIAYNKNDCMYFDVLADLVDRGVNWTVVGRRILLWPASRSIGMTQQLVVGQDIQGDVTVTEDGLALATRVIATGGDTFGATTIEPEIENVAINPSCESNASGFRAVTPKWFNVIREAHSAATDLKPENWTSGNYHGRLRATPPQAPPKPTPITDAWQELQRAYEWSLFDFDQMDTVMDMWPQRIVASGGEWLSATMLVIGRGSPMGRIGLRLIGVGSDGEPETDAFEEGPPVRLSPWKRQQVFVSGKVPAHLVGAYVEVFRDTDTKWRNTNVGFWFDDFAIWRGRIEAWFDGNTPDTADFDYRWNGAPNNSSSKRIYKHPFHDDYYGLVERRVSSDSSSRTALEKVAQTVLRKSYPSPLVVDVPGNAPLSPAAPVELSHLVPGVAIPIQVATVCRPVDATTILEEVAVTYDADLGEEVTVSVVANEVKEVGDVHGWATDHLQSFEPGDFWDPNQPPQGQTLETPGVKNMEGLQVTKETGDLWPAT